MAGNKVYVQGHYVDVHDNEVVNISIDKVGTMHVGEANVAGAQEEAVPALLDTPRAHELWQKVPEGCREGDKMLFLLRYVARFGG